MFSLICELQYKKQGKPLIFNNALPMQPFVFNKTAYILVLIIISSFIDYNEMLSLVF